MPQGGRVGRSIAKSQGAFVTPIVTNNPVFQVKLIDVDDKLEQPAAQQKPMKDEIRRGEAVIGTALGRDNKKKHKGIVDNIIKDANGNVTSFTIVDEEGDQIKLDPTSVSRLDLHDDGKNKVAGDDFKVMEKSNRAKDFNTWLNESKEVNESFYPSTRIGAIRNQKDLDKFDNDPFIQRMYKQDRIMIEELDTSYDDEWQIFIDKKDKEVIKFLKKNYPQHLQIDAYLANQLAESVNEELLNPGNLPTPPSKLTDMLRMPNTSAFRNRIIVHLEGGTLDGWYDYNEGYHPGDGSWYHLKYSDDKKKQENIIFDQDVIEDSENDKESKAWKKWLVGMSKKPGYAFKVKEVYLGET